MANFENITIEKGMYQTKGGISGALEKLDPSENYRGCLLYTSPSPRDRSLSRMPFSA